MDITKILLEKEIVDLKFDIDNAREDKNILINRIETLELELAMSNKKITEWK